MTPDKFWYIHKPIKMYYTGKLLYMKTVGKLLKTELKIHHHYDTKNEGETEWFYTQDPK